MKKNLKLDLIEEDVDSLPPPPLDEGGDRQPHLLPPRPAPRKGGHPQDVMVSRIKIVVGYFSAIL